MDCVLFIVGSAADSLGTVWVCTASLHSQGDQTLALSENTWDSLESMAPGRGHGSPLPTLPLHLALQYKWMSLKVKLPFLGDHWGDPASLQG